VVVVLVALLFGPPQPAAGPGPGDQAARPGPGDQAARPGTPS